MPERSSRFAQLKDLDAAQSSEQRREILRSATDALLKSGREQQKTDPAALDNLMLALATDHSAHVRAEVAKLVAATSAPVPRTGRLLAMDEIAVAEPILRDWKGLTDGDLLNVIAQKPQSHLLAVSKRQTLSQNVSHALVEKGDDIVVSSLLENKGADIGHGTYEKVAERAQGSAVLHAPFARRAGVPLDLLNDLYFKVEPGLRADILRQFDGVPPEVLDAAIEKSRTRISNALGDVPPDFVEAQRRIDLMQRKRELQPPVLATLLREGKAGRTAFKLALSRLTDVAFDLANRAVEGCDFDTIALLSRASGFDRALFVTIAIALDKSDRALAAAEAYGRLYESVPVSAAQRAMRFWKVRATT